MSVSVLDPWKTSLKLNVLRVEWRLDFFIYFYFYFSWTFLEHRCEAIQPSVPANDPISVPFVCCVFKMKSCCITQDGGAPLTWAQWYLFLTKGKVSEKDWDLNRALAERAEQAHGFVFHEHTLQLEHCRTSVCLHSSNCLLLFPFLLGSRSDMCIWEITVRLLLSNLWPITGNVSIRT